MSENTSLPENINTDDTAAAPVKKQGPIRFEAIIPAAVIFTLAGLYFTFFFDSHLRRGIEYAAGTANGAEVNIGSVRSRFFDLSLEISDIQVTDAGMPSRNLVQIGSIRFQMLTDAVLRSKIVIEDASINNIQFQTQRKSPGEVYASSGDDTMTVLQNKFRGMYSKNILGELVQFASSENPKHDLAEKAKNLETVQKIQELSANLEEKKAAWQKRLDAMPDPEKIRALEKKIKAMQAEKKQDPLEVAAALKDLADIQKDLEEYSNTVRESKIALQKDSAQYFYTIKDLDSIIEEDVRNLQKEMNIPRFDRQSLAGALLGDEFFGYIYTIKNYADTARSYIPEKSEDEEFIKITPPDRSSGTDYIFGKPNSYPAFWLKKAKISSDGAGQFQGISGELNHVSSSPASIGQPLSLTLKGSIPDKNIMDVSAAVFIDHTKIIPGERLVINVGTYPIKNKILSKNSDTELILESAECSLHLEAEIRGSEIRIKAKNYFSKLKFKSSAKSPILQDIFNSALPEMKAISLNAEAEGTWDDLKFSFSSNFADILEEEFKKYLKGKLAEAQKEVEDMIKSRISGQHDTLLGNYKDTDSLFRQKIAEREKMIESAKSELIQSQTDLKKKGGKNQLQQELLKKGAGELLKGM